MAETVSAEQLLADAAWLKRLATTLAGNELDADDLVQESWIAAWRRKPDGDRPLRPWLSKVIRDVAGMKRRSERRRSLREQEIVQDEQVVSPPDALLDQMRLHRLLVDLVLELDEPYRSTIVAHFVEGKTSAAIARAHSIPESTVRGRLREGLARLRAGLDAARGDRKAWAPAVLAFAKGGIQVAKPTKSILLLILALLALLGGVAVVAVVRHRDPKHESTSTGSAPSNANLARSSADRDTSTRPVPIWFGQRGAPAKRISGHVLFEDKPVADAVVSLSSMLTDAGAFAQPVRRTNADGSFDFGVVPAGGYTVAAAANGRVAAIEFVALDDPTRKPPADKLELRLQACSGSVAGTIVDAIGNAIPHARVRRDGIVGVEADEHGRYRICTPRGESISLTYSADGYGAVALTIDVQGEAHKDVVLVPEATLSVRALQRDGNQPIEDALVNVWPAQWGADHAAPVHALTDKDGRARVTGLVPGAYTVSASAGHASTSSPLKVQVTAGPNPDVALRLEARARIRGKVVNAQGPVAGAAVSAFRKSPPGPSVTVHSQADGSFVLDGVALGELSFKAAPYRVVSPASLRATEPKEYDVVLEVSQLGSITGRVTRHGKPVAGADVCCIRDIRGLDGKTKTDALGRYEYRGVAAGTYDLWAQTTEEFVQSTKVSLAEAEDRTIDLELNLAATITGTVIDQDGKPVVSAYVKWTNEMTGDIGHCNTDAQGRYHCAAMTGGARYRGGVFPTSAMQKPFPPAGNEPYPAVELKDGSSVVENVQLAITYQHLSISGHVVDDAGLPVADARLEALQAQDGAPPVFQPWLRIPSTFTDSDGAFTLDGLLTGTYTVHAHAAEGGDGLVSDAAAGSTGVTIKIVRPASIRGTLTAFAAAPLVYARPIGTLTGDSTAVWGVVDGNAFRITGLAPGRYLVDAQTQAEGDIQVVEVHPGEAATVAMTARGRGAIEATVLDFRTRKPIAGASCQSFLSIGGELGATNWDLASAPTSDAAGHVTLEPAPAGSVDVACIMPGVRWSRPSAHAVLAPGGHATVQLYSVETLSDMVGTLGLVFDGMNTSPRVAAVTPGSSGAKAGLLVGDLVTAVNGTSVQWLNGDGVSSLIDGSPIGSDVTVAVMRGGALRTITAKLEPRQ